MSTLAIKNKFVKSEVMFSGPYDPTTVDPGFSINEVFAAVEYGLLGGASTGLDLTNLAAPAIDGDKLIAKSITTAKIAAGAINGEDDIADRQIIRDHLDFSSDGSIEEGKLDLNPANTGDPVGVFTTMHDGSDQDTHQMVVAAATKIITIEGYISTTTSVSITFSDSYFEDPGFSESPRIKAMLSYGPSGFMPPLSLQYYGMKIENVTTSGFDAEIKYTNTATGSYNARIAWLAIGKASLS